ncbi:MAG: ATP-binding protein [Chitinophagales bacterium]|nr:ATP-binding protein [Chitinophagales bacterium]
MIPRAIEPVLKKALRQFPVVVLTGPRQSGKTTIVENLAGYKYVNLEHPDLREYAREDSRGFLSEYGKGKLVIDEAQYVPQLFSYIQAESDKHKKPGKFVLTGSQNFLLLQNISQSLAGRTAILELLPLSVAELQAAGKLPATYEQFIFKGGYPRLYGTKANKQLMMSGYIRTYVERDVRQIVNVQNLSLFNKFLKSCAARVGQLLNYSSIGNELGIDHKTIMKWMSILQSSYIIYLLQPYHRNFNKRLVKTPKLYFYDTGLATELLGLQDVKHLYTYPQRGELYENLVLTELIKRRLNNGTQPNLCFWRDSTGNEVDFIEEIGSNTEAYEVKSAKTITPTLFRGLETLKALSGSNIGLNLVYGGVENTQRNGIDVLNWKGL